MPTAPKKYCCRCLNIALPGSSYCAEHQNAKAEADRQRKAADELRPLYNTQRWRKRVRMRVLSRDGQCRAVWDGVRCLGLSRHVHHIRDAGEWMAQHGGDVDSFFDESNLAGLCDACHSKITSARRTGIDLREAYADTDDTFNPVI
ncbi:MAG: hypothetical protein WCC22_07535 [Terriglobales bacterium]